MKRQELQAEIDRLTYSLNSIKNSIGSASDEVVASACLHLCVAICGSLEQNVKKILTAYAKLRSNNSIHRPIAKLCDSYQNPKATKILELAELFDKDFQRELEIRWNDENSVERDHLNNLVDDRINIAHRKSHHTSVSISKLENYLRAYRGLSTHFFDHFLG